MDDIQAAQAVADWQAAKLVANMRTLGFDDAEIVRDGQIYRLLIAKTQIAVGEADHPFDAVQELFTAIIRKFSCIELDA